MKKRIQKLVDQFKKGTGATRAGEFRVSSPAHERTKEAIRFTIQTYGETFRDLAKYDRGERFSH